MESFRGGALQIQIQEVFEFYATSIHTFSLGRCQFPSALMRVVALMALFCSIHSFLCNRGDRMERLDRHLTSEGCSTLSMAKTSDKARVLSIRIQSHYYSISLYYYYSRTLNVTPSNLYVVKATHSERCTLDDLYSYFYYYYYNIIAIILITIILISIITVTINIVIITIIIITSTLICIIIIITITSCCRTN